MMRSTQVRGAASSAEVATLRHELADARRQLAEVAANPSQSFEHARKLAYAQNGGLEDISLSPLVSYKEGQEWRLDRPSTVPEAAALAIFGDLEMGRSGSSLEDLGLGDLQSLHFVDRALQGLAALMAWRADLRLGVFGIWLFCHALYMTHVFVARLF